MNDTGVVFDIQRFCTDDGQGIRTAVFLKGCNLRCEWCHNPESFLPKPEIAYDETKCAFCGRCADICPQKAHMIQNGAHLFDRAKCVACGRCADVCPNGALRLYGKEMTAEDIMAVVRRDKRYYDASGGGVTLTGGEPMLQAPLVMNLLRNCREEHIGAALESNMTLPFSLYEQTLPMIDLFLCDMKLYDSAAHERMTGIGNERVLDNLRCLSASGARIWLRCPIIPGVNDTAAHFAFLRALRDEIHPEKTEIMPYHDLGKAKWRALGLTYSLENLPSATPEQAETWRKEIT